jgi:amino acid permease
VWFEPAGPRVAGAGVADVARPGDGWATLRAVSVEQRDVHGRRSARSGKESATRVVAWLWLVVTFYLLANLAYVVTLPLAGIQNAPQNRVATAVMQAVLGPSGTIIMALAIMISTFGCNNGLILAGARVYYAMARDGLFFKRVDSVNAHHVPAVALIAQGLWASFLVLPRTVTLINRRGLLVWKRLHATAGIHCFRGFDLLRVDGWRGDRDAAQGAGD